MNLSRLSIKKFLKQYLALVVSLFIMTFGVSLSIRTNLGSSAISVWPYVWSMAREPFNIFGHTFTVPAMSLGQYTYIMNFLLVGIQVILLKRDFAPVQFGQLLLGFLFGAFLDITMWLTAPFQWDSSMLGYTFSIIQLIIAGTILAFGITCEVRCKALMMPGEGFPVAIAKVTHSDFGKIKIFTDSGLVLSGVAFSYIFFGEWRWDMIGIGTLFSMIYVGIAVRMLSPHTKWLTTYLFGKQDNINTTIVSDNITAPCVITIARQYGSGGHEIGEKLAKKLGYKFYDREIIHDTATEMGLAPEYIEKAEQRISNSKLLELILTDKQLPEGLQLSENDSIFVTQSRIIHRLATTQPCVIIGRCADYILSNHPNRISVFIYSDTEFACKRIAAENNISLTDAEHRIRQTNQERANHYRQYTDRRWDDTSHYDIALNSSSIGIDAAVELIAKIVINQIAK